MSFIKLLSSELVNQIAAGEVVERPASVVKELVENSLDAGATDITVEIEDGGLSLIRISDNGRGIAKDDLPLAIVKHATSKIALEQDLWQIRTLGFRGEALASISSVSEFKLLSKAENSTSAYQLILENDQPKITEAAHPTGTSIFVQNLFHNTPARKKFLKNAQNEFQKISQTLTKVALSNPKISFKLIHNQKVTFDYPKVQQLKERIIQVFGLETSEALLEVFYQSSDLKISGFIGKPSLSRTTSQHQYLNVNSRPIQHGLIANRLKAAYSTMLMEHKKPIFILNLEIPPEMIDVNVHPRKLEIRFQNEGEVIKNIYKAAVSALNSTPLIPKAYSESRRYLADTLPSSFVKEPTADFYKPMSQKSFDFVPPQTPRSAQPLVHQEIPNFHQPQTTAISQVEKRYIVAKSASGLILLDQHAAHERVRFEELMREFHNQTKNSQPLLLPLEIQFTPAESALIAENLSTFLDLGFEIEPFSAQSYIIHAVPHCLGKEDLSTVIKGLLDDIRSGERPTNLQGKTEQILTYLACRSAIKFGQTLALDEMQSLINQLEKCDKPWTCPHGRPTMIALTLSELEKMFGRKK